MSDPKTTKNTDAQTSLSHQDSNALVFDPRGGLPRLREIMRRLRDPKDGCPWDLEQTLATLAPYAIEEAHEVADAIERRAWNELRGELGDVLFQVVFQSHLAQEADLFTLDDVIATLCDKMVTRHPHIFGDESRDKSAAQQTIDWENLKARERGQNHRTLEGVAKGLPALSRAIKLQNRAARVGFDWPSTDQVLSKLAEEVTELAQAHRSKDAAHITEEFGDLLFAFVNLARHWGVDPEVALHRTNAKFIRRFHRIEDWLNETGRRPEDSDLTEMDHLWNRAKQEERETK